MPDALTPERVPGDAARDAPTPPPPVAPGPEPTAGPATGGRPPRRPSWWRAALWSLVVLAAGVVVGGAGYRLERAYLIQPPAVERTGDELVLTARPGHVLGGLELDGPRLIWQDGASVEYLDTTGGDVVLLGPGPGMRATWQPALSDRFAVWFEAERRASLAARLVVYDTKTGRRRALDDIGSVRSYPSLSGDLAVWCSALRPGQPGILGARVAGPGRLIRIAKGDGAPVVSGGLVVWARSRTGPFTAEDLVSRTTWPVAASVTAGALTGIALSGRTLMWGQTTGEDGSGVVSAVDVDGGGRQNIASGVTGLAGPSYDGTTVVWAETTASGARVMARRPGAGNAFVVAAVHGAVPDVAVSGGTAAWVQTAGGSWSIVVKRLPR